MRAPTIKVITVTVDGSVYELHTGRPGRPRIYRRTARGHKRVNPADPVITKIAAQYRKDVDERKAAAERKIRREHSRLARIRHWFGRLLGRLLRR